MSDKKSPFAYADSILNGKKLDYDDYNPFMVNRALSYHKDVIFYVNEMNMRYSLPKDAQYEFLFNVIEKRKRNFAKWQKAELSEDSALIIEYYKVNSTRALEILRLLNKNEIDVIRERLYKGGMGNDL